MAYVKRDQPRTNANLVGELQRDLDAALELLHKKELELSKVVAMNADLDSVVKGLMRDNNQLRLDIALVLRRAKEGVRP